MRTTDEIVASELVLWTSLERRKVGRSLLVESALAGELGRVGRIGCWHQWPEVMLILRATRVLKHDLVFTPPWWFTIERSNHQKRN